MRKHFFHGRNYCFFFITDNVYIPGFAGLCIVVAISFSYFFLASKCSHKIPLQEISLSQRTSVFIAYTDDSEPHTDCIAALAKMLQDDANVDVFIDQFELKHSGIYIFLCR